LKHAATITALPFKARLTSHDRERFDVHLVKRNHVAMRLRAHLLLALAAGCVVGCEETPLLKERSGVTHDPHADAELTPREESADAKSPVTDLPPEEGRAKLAALLERLEEASEQAAQAEDDIPLVFGAVADAKGNRYVGQFKDGKRHGYGTYQFANGDRFEGEYLNGKREGYGTYQFKKGDRYVGYFHDGKYHRWGAYFFPNGDKYFGQYTNGKRNGKGTLSRANGERYEGEFKEGKRHGLGHCAFSNGDHYAGSWKNGEPEGWGTYHYGSNKAASGKTGGSTAQTSTTKESPSAKLPEGLPPETRDALATGDQFLTEALQLNPNSANALPPFNPSVDSSLNSPLSLAFPSNADKPLVPTLRELPGGDRYVGQLRDGQPHGQGAYLFSDGERYVGDFLHGRHHGQGLLILGDGRRYLGEWKDGLRHGYGVLYDPEGLVEREGHWIQDQLVGN